MAEHDSDRRRDPRIGSAERVDPETIIREQSLRDDRSQLKKLAGVIRFADFMAILMVLATAFSAYATWRTAQVTNLVFEIADRPFLGVEKVIFDAPESARPTISVVVRDFANIPALDALVSVHTLVDGKLVKLADPAMSTLATGILSPGVPHPYYAFLTPELYRAVVAGKSNLQLHVRMLYKGPAHRQAYCYFERVIFDSQSSSFRMAGGSDRCGTDVF